MANEYSLIDKDDNVFLINNPAITENNIFNSSLTKQQDNIKFAFETIEKTALPGSILTRQKKLASGNLRLTATLAYTDQQVFLGGP